MQRIMEILDKHKTSLLSMMTLPPEREDDDWRAFLHPFHIASAAGYSLSVLMNEDDSLSFTLFRII